MLFGISVFGDKFKNMTCEEHEQYACEYRDQLQNINNVMPTVVGEWSLATPINCNNNRANIAKQQVGVYESTSSGWFFWAHKNEQKWESWSFEDSFRNGWLKPMSNYTASC